MFMPARRDPISETFDAAARRLLARAYDNPGTWVSTRLADAGPRARTRAIALRPGYDPDGPDDASTYPRKGGGLNARSAWARSFVRSCYDQHKWWSADRKGRHGWWRAERRAAPRDSRALRIEVGRHIPASPQFDPRHPERGGFPPGRAIRVQLAQGGAAKQRAVARLANRDRIWENSGDPALRFSYPEARQWQ